MQAVERRAFRGTVYGFIQFGLTFAQTILLVPLLLSNWGKDKYGVYIAIFAFIQILRTIDIGHQSYIGNEYGKTQFLDKHKANSILASSIMMALVLGGIEFLLFIVLWFTGAVYSLLAINPQDSTMILLGVMCMVLMWWIVGSVSGIMARVVLCKGLYPESVLWDILLKILEIILLVIAGIINLSLFNLLWMLAVINVVIFAIVLRWSMRHFIEVKQIWSMGNWREAVINFRNSIILTFNNVFEQLNLNGIVFLITRFISLAMLPVFVTIRTVTNTAVQVTSLIVNPLQPELIRYHSEKSGEKIYSVIQTVWIISGILINISFLVVMPFITSLYTLWTKDILILNRELFFLLCLSVSLANFGKVLTVYLTGINDLKAITLMSGVRCIVVFGLSVVFIQDWGLTAVGLGFIVAEILSSVVLPLYLIKRKLSKIQVTIKSNDIVLALLPVSILALCFITDLLGFISSMYIALLGIGVMVSIYYLQWNRLEKEVQSRLKTLAFHVFRRE